MGRNLPSKAKPATTDSTVPQGTSTTGFNPSAATVSYITSFLPGATAPTKATEAELNKQLIDMTPAERIAYATRLKNAGYSVGPITGAVTKDLRRAWLTSHSDLTSEIQAGQALDFNTYLAQNAGAGGTGRAGTTIATSEISDTAAAALINQIYKDFTGEEATAEEIALRKKQLRQAQAANPIKTVYDSTGRSKTTGGIDTGEFIAEQIKGTEPVKEQRMRDAQTLLAQEIGGLR